MVSDQVNHASIVDACRLSRARVVITPHRDVDRRREGAGRPHEEHAVVVTDAVFSVDGDLAPLAELHEAAVRHGALLIVDEAHALGVVGDARAGRGRTPPGSPRARPSCRPSHCPSRWARRAERSSARPR